MKSLTSQQTTQVSGGIDEGQALIVGGAALAGGVVSSILVTLPVIDQTAKLVSIAGFTVVGGVMGSCLPVVGTAIGAAGGLFAGYQLRDFSTYWGATFGGAVLSGAAAYFNL